MESTMPAQRLPGTTRLLRETASEAPGAGTDALEGLVWQRRVHLSVKKPEGVSLPTGRPTGPFSFPVMSQREWRGGRGSGPSVLRAFPGWLPGPVHLSDCGTLLGTPVALRAPTATSPPNKGPASPGRRSAWAAVGQGGLARGSARRPRAGPRKEACPRRPRRRPCPSRNGLSSSPDDERLLAFRPEAIASPSRAAGWEDGAVRARVTPHPEEQETAAWDPPPLGVMEGHGPGAPGRSCPGLNGGLCGPGSAP